MQSGEQFQKRRFAAAVGPGEKMELARIEIHMNTFQRGLRRTTPTKRKRDVAKRDSWSITVRQRIHEVPSAKQRRANLARALDSNATTSADDASVGERLRQDLRSDFGVFSIEGLRRGEVLADSEGGIRSDTFRIANRRGMEGTGHAPTWNACQHQAPYFTVC